MRRIIILTISMFLLGSLSAENFFWMNGSGNWDDPGHRLSDQYNHTFNGKIPKTNASDQSIQLNENAIIANLHWEAGEIDGYKGAKLIVSGELNTSKTVTDKMIEKSIEQGSGTLNNHIDLNSSDSDKEKLSAQTPNNKSIEENLGAETKAAPAFTAVNVTNASCNGLADGIIEIIVDDADEYSIDDGATWQVGNKFFGLSAGFYNVKARKGVDETAWGANPIEITEPDPLSYDGAAITHVTCNGEDDGTITLNVSGGTPPYTYDAGGGLSQTGDNFFENLAPTSYTFNITDNNGCPFGLPVQSTKLTVLEAPAFSVTGTTPTAVTCGGADDGELEITVSGGQPDYTYRIEGQASGDVFTNTTSATTYTFTGLPGDDYIITVTDAYGCTKPDPAWVITVTEPATLTINNVNVTNVTGCAGNTNGAIQINAVGGTGTKFYSINDGVSFFPVGGTFSNLPAGDYNIQVRDQNGCIAVWGANPVTITEPDSVEITLVNITQPTCFGDNGTVTITTVIGGDGGPYEYSSDNGATWQAGNAFTLPEGTYNMVARDGNLCESEPYEAVVDAPDQITFNATPTNVACNGGNDGQIVVSNVAGGSGAGYEYSSDGGTTFQASNTFLNLTAATYNIVVRDGNLCESPASPTVVDEPDAITYTPVVNSNVLCNGSNEGEIEVTNVLGGTAPYEYSNDGGATWQASATFSSLTAGTYNIQVRDVNLCTSVVTPRDITEPGAINFTPVTNSQVTCNSGNNGEIEITNVTGGTGPFTYSKNGGTTWQASATFSNLLAGDYDMQVRDANLCVSAVQQVTISEPLAITFTPVKNKDVTCNGGSDGEVEITLAAGGTPPYTYSSDGGVTWQASATFSNLAAGTHNMQVRDVNLCLSAQIPVTIVEPDAILFTPVVNDNVTCNGGNDGEIEVTNVSGGTAPYEYSNDGGATWQASATFSNLIEGTYNMQVRDVNLCTTASDPTVVTEPDAIAFNTNVTNATCNGADDGIIVVTNVTGGAPPYKYSNDGGATWQVSNIFTALAVASYNIQVRDVNLCTSPIQATPITEPDPIDFNPVVNQNVTCNTGGDGEIEIKNVTGGTAPYEYSNDGGTTWQGSPIFSGLTAGSYDMQVRDVNLCVSAIKATPITEPDALAFNTNLTNVTCNGGSDGVIQIINVTGGTPGYEYSIDKGTTWQAGNTFNGLTAGPYNVVVRDANLCESDPVVVTLTEPDVVDFDTDMTPATCNGNVDGQIEVTNVTGGTPGYTYSNDGGATWQAGATFAGLAPGDYDIQVRDVNLCLSAIQTVTVTEPDPIAFNTDVTNVSCNAGSDGVIEVINVTGGTPAYQYSNDGGATWQASATFGGLIAGSYNIQVRDANLCTSAVVPTTVTEPNAIDFTLVVNQNVTCNGGNDGEIEVTTETGGTPGFEYTIDNGINWQASPIFSGLVAGTYDIQLRDANSCLSVVKQATITEPDPITFNTTVNQNVTCFGGADGEIEVTNVLGGTPGYEYSNDGGATWQASSVFSGLTAVDYTIVVRDVNLCESDPAIVTITEPDVVDFTPVVNQNVTCNGGSDGEIEATAVTGGTPPYEYSNDGGATWQAGATFAGLVAGDYDMQVRDVNLCVSAIKQIAVAEPDAIDFNADMTTVTCNGGADGTITINNVTGGTPPYEYSNDGGATWQASPIFGGLVAATYNMQVRDANLCTSAVQPKDVTEPDPLANINATVTNVTCNGGSDGEIEISGVTGGIPPYEYSNDGGATWQSSAIFAGLSAGTYNMQVRDANLCTSPLIPTDVLEPAAITFTPIVNANVTCFGGADGEIEVTNVLGGTPGYEYSNDGGTTWQGSTVFSGLVAGDYTIVVRDVNLCESDPAIVTITEPDVVDFTPVVNQNVTCNGGSDGEIEATAVTGGTPPYEYSNDGGATWQAGATFAGLVAGDYDMQVRDVNLCVSAIKQITVIEPDPILFDSTVVNVSCNGGNDGSIEVTNVTGGTAPYEYSNDGGVTFQASPAFNLLTAGTYNIQVRDVNLCVSAIVPIEVTDPDPIDFDRDQNDVSCNGGSDGSLEFTNVTGGTPVYEYSIDGGLTYQPNPLFENLPVGNYNMIIRDANLCLSAVTPVTITEPDAITFNTNTTNITCNGGNDGEIEVVGVLGGSGVGYEYSNDNGVTFQASNIFAGLSADTYDIVVRDGNGCLSPADPVILTEPDAITYDTTLTNISCNGGGNGSIEVIDVLGGTLPYEYSIDNGASWQAAALFENLAVGSYDIIVRDANLCLSDVSTATLTEPDPIVVTLIDSLLSCGSLPVIDGNPLPLPDGSGVSYETTLEFSDFDDGQVLNVGDIESVYLNIEHSYPGDLIIELVAPDNSIVLTQGRGGTRNLGYPVTGDEASPVPGEGYVYTFDDNASKAWTTVTSENHYYNGIPGSFDSLYIPSGTYIPENSFDGLAGTVMNGQWKLRVTDQFPVDNGFIFKWGIRFNESAYPANYCNGMLEVAATGGNGGFTYDWSTGQTGSQITDLCADGYTVTVTDSKGCSVEYTDSVYNVDMHLEVTDTTHVACAGDATGSASVLALGGNAPYNYDWSNGATGQTATNLTAGWYFITITDNNQCEHVDSLEIRSLYDLQLVFSDTIPITCNPLNIGDSTGSVTVTPIGGTGNYTYTWSSSDGNDSVAMNLTQGWNYVTVTDDFCSAIDSVFLDTPAPIRIIETFHQDVLCNSDTTGAISVVVNNGEAPLTLEWDHITDLDVYDLVNLGSGSYTAYATDNNACMADTTIEITEPAPYSYDVVVTPADCGTDNGSIEVQNILGGDGNYTVTWSHPDWTVDSVGLSIANLGVGNYTLMIQDGNLCDTVEVINMPDNSDISATLVSKVDPTCATNCDGQATIEITGGTEPYTITWSNGAVDVLSVNDLCDGTFSVLIVDGNNCSVELIDSIQAPDPIVMNGFVYTEPIACAGDSLAEVYISAEGGTDELSYLWEDTTGTVVSADSILTNAKAGNRYYVTVSDANLCEYVDSIDITEMPDSLLMAFNTGVTNCPEDSTGWAAVDVTGGVGPYSFNWYKSDDLAFPIVGFDTDSASSLAFGYYVVEVTDMLGCTAIDSVIIQSNTTLDFDVEVLQEVTCEGNGSARVTNIVDGTGPFEYLWSTGETTDTAYALNVGVNSVILTDLTSSCSVLKEFEMSDDSVFNVRIYELRPDYITGVDGNGLIRLEATGGIKPYAYEWADEDGPLTDNDSLLFPLDQGMYYYTVTDALGCAVTDSAEIIETSIYIQDTLITNVSCFGYDNGAITIVPAGGVPPYTTYWNDGTWAADSVGNTITNLVAGTYYLTITDLFSSYEDSLVVTEPQPYVYNKDITAASCAGADGQIIIEVESGGTEPFTYTWQYNGYPELDPEGLAWAWPGDTTVVNDTITDLHVGYYYFTLVDGGGCTTFDSVFLPDNSDFVIDPIVLNPNCLSPTLNNGSISLNPENGADPITYNWSHDTGLNSDIAANLSEGDYAVTVIDNNMCVRNDAFTLTAPVEVDFEYDITQPACSYDTTGTLTITPIQGNGEFQYAVFLTGGTPDYQSNPEFLNLGTGQYTIRVLDEASCLEDKPALIESETSEILITEVNDMPGCPTDADGIVGVEVTAGLPFTPFTSLSYEWMIDSATLAAWGAGEEMYDSIISTESEVLNARPGVYNVKVITGTGCFEEQNITLLSDTSFVFDDISVNLVDTSIYGPFANYKVIDVCKYDKASFYAAPYAIKADPYQIIDPDTVYWKQGSGLVGHGMSAGNIAFDTAIVNQNGTNYFVARIVAGRCYMEDSVALIVPNYPDVVASIADGEYTQVFENGRTVLDVNSITDSTYYSWSEYWEVTGEQPPMPTLPDFADSTDIREIEVTQLRDSTIYTVFANTPSPYPVGGKFCATSDTVKVRVMGEFNPPSAFSPNGDGINDTWIIYGIDENFAFNLKIYNRWGQLVFESKSANEMLNEGWDGTNINGNDVTIGTYYYVIEYSDGTKTRKSNGPVTVIR